MSMSRQNVWRTAHSLIKRYGKGAIIHAALQMEEFFDEGEFQESAAWESVLEALEELFSEDIPRNTFIH